MNDLPIAQLQTPIPTSAASTSYKDARVQVTLLGDMAYKTAAGLIDLINSDGEDNVVELYNCWLATGGYGPCHYRYYATDGDESTYWMATLTLLRTPGSVTLPPGTRKSTSACGITWTSSRRP